MTILLLLHDYGYNANIILHELTHGSLLPNIADYQLTYLAAQPQTKPDSLQSPSNLLLSANDFWSTNHPSPKRLFNHLCT